MTRKRVIACLSLLVLVAALASQATPPAAFAAPALQLTPFPTPTPGPDGRIVYIVQPGDTLLRIALISGLDINELRGLNNIIGDNIAVGQELLLGLGGPSQPSPQPGPSPTPTPLLPTPSAIPGLGELCIILYNDLNGDSIRQETEPSIPEGAISVNNRLGSISENVPTGIGTDPHCFPDLPEGEFTISVAIPEGYNPTTVTNYVLMLNAGDQTFLDFGAQANTETIAQAPAPTGGGRSPLLGVLGGIFLLAGVGVAVFAARLLKRK
jgi:hypothetical protein